MILYHIDRAGSLSAGKIIQLQNIHEVLTDVKNSPFTQLFDDGVSVFGREYLNINSNVLPVYPVLFEGKPRNITVPTINVNDFLKNKYSVDNKLIELVCEMVRRTFFKKYPSRLQSLFAVHDISEFSKWPELLRSDQESNIHQDIYKIEVSDKTPCFDANHLRGGIVAGIDAGQRQPGFYYGVRIDLMFDCAYRYWSGELTDNPRMEYLVKLPVKIGPRIEINAV